MSVTSDSGITEEGRTGNKGIARITLNTAGTDTRLGITVSMLLTRLANVSLTDSFSAKMRVDIEHISVNWQEMMMR